MNETKWLRATSWTTPLRYLEPKASERKLRLFSLGCCGLIDHYLTDPRSRNAIEFVQRYAEVGLRGKRHRRSVGRAAYEAQAEWVSLWQQTTDPVRRDELARKSNAAFAAFTCVTAYPPSRSASLIATHTARVLHLEIQRSWAEPVTSASWQTIKARSDAPVLALLRDVFGNPFRPSALDARFLTSDVLGLARPIYEDRAFDRLPLLADALLDAGCEDEAIISHCRSPGPHVRGCWVLDLLLSRS